MAEVDEEVTLESVQALVKRRDEMEDEIKLKLELLSDYGVGMDAPLVDEDGYPKSSLDLPAIREARHSVYCVRNDIKDVVQEIDIGLGIVHEKARKEKEKLQGSSMPSGPSHVKEDQLEPFARVGRVSENSPAHNAGLIEGDLVLKFGSITQRSFAGVPGLAALVNSSEDRPMQVAVLRSRKRKDSILKPRRWKGQGLLGCFITPIAE